MATALFFSVLLAVFTCASSTDYACDVFQVQSMHITSSRLLDLWGLPLHEYPTSRAEILHGELVLFIRHGSPD